MTIYGHLLNPDATCIPGVTCSADVHIARYEWAASYLKDKVQDTQLYIIEVEK